MPIQMTIDEAYEELKWGNIEEARTLLDQARDVAQTASERDLCHSLGNAIQRKILTRYLEE